MPALETVHVTGTGQAIATGTEVQVRSIHWRDAGGVTGSIVFRDYGASGTVLWTLDTDANNGEHIWPLAPDYVQFFDGVHVTLTNVDSLTILYYG